MATMALVWAPRESSVRRDTGAPVPPPITTARTSPSDGSRPVASSSAANAAVADASFTKGASLGLGTNSIGNYFAFPALVGLVVRHQRSVGALGQAQVAVRDAHAVAVGAQVVRGRLGDRDAAVLAARAADGDGELLLALGDVAPA